MSDRIHHRFGPHVIQIARFLAESEIPPDSVVQFFVEVSRRWPGIRDFMGAAVLAEALAMKPVGNA